MSSYPSCFLNKKRYLMLSKKDCEDVIEKSVPRDQRLSSLGKHRDAKGDPWNGFFYHTHTCTFMINS